MGFPVGNGMLTWVRGTALSCDEVLKGSVVVWGGGFGRAQRYSLWRGWPAHGNWWGVSPKVIQPGHRTPVEPPRQLDAQET